MSTGIVKPNWVLVKGEYKYVLDQQINNIGRRDPNNPAKALEVTLEDLTVSKQHARIENNEGRLTLIPFDTSNKTKLNKKKVNPKERYDLTAGDEIFFGKDGPYRVVDLNGVIKPSIIDTGVERQVERPGMERQMKKATDEKISLTSPDAKFWMDLKIRERLNEESILNKHANRIKETDSKKARLEFLNNRRLQLEDTINSMKIKGEEIDNERKKITEERNRLEQESTQGKETYMKVDEIHLDEHLSKGTRRICS